jgi:hypothetical protein
MIHVFCDVHALMRVGLMDFLRCLSPTHTQEAIFIFAVFLTVAKDLQHDSSALCGPLHKVPALLTAQII